MLQGMEMNLCKMLRRGKTISTIVDELELDAMLVERVYEVALKFAPEYDHERVIEAWLLRKEKQ